MWSVVFLCAIGILQSGQFGRVVPRVVEQSHITAGVTVGDTQHAANAFLRHGGVGTKCDKYIQGGSDRAEQAADGRKQHIQRSRTRIVGNDQQHSTIAKIFQWQIGMHPFAHLIGAEYGQSFGHGTAVFQENNGISESEAKL